MKFTFLVIVLIFLAATIICFTIRYYKKEVYLKKIAMFYKDHHFEVPMEDTFCISIHTDYPSLADCYPNLVNGEQIEQQIKTIIREFKNNPDFLKKTENEYVEYEVSKVSECEKQREKYKKEAIIDRVFAYEYEDILFQIYAPLVAENSKKRCSYSWDTRVTLSRSELLQKIAEIKNVSEKEAEDILSLLINHSLIEEFHGRCELTYFLCDESINEFRRWNIISDNDTNLSKWMYQHGYGYRINIHNK